jgi:hypothetical protein
VNVNSRTTVNELIRLALDKFGIQQQQVRILIPPVIHICLYGLFVFVAIKDSMDSYSIIEVLWDDKPVEQWCASRLERSLENDECPLQTYRINRKVCLDSCCCCCPSCLFHRYVFFKESLCNHRRYRFYLKEKNHDSPSVSVYIGNLPSGLSQIQYEKILMDSLKNTNGEQR